MKKSWGLVNTQTWGSYLMSQSKTSNRRIDQVIMIQGQEKKSTQRNENTANVNVQVK